MSNNANKRKSNGVSVGNDSNLMKKNDKIAKTSTIEKNEVPLKKQKIENVVQQKNNKDVKMAESSDSSDSSSDDEPAIKKTPIASKATQKADIKTQPSKNNSTPVTKKTAAVESSESESDGSSESEEEVEKPVVAKKVTAPATSKNIAQKNTTTPSKKIEADSSSSDSSSEEESSSAPKSIEKKIVVEKKVVVEKSNNTAKNTVDTKKTVPEKKSVVEKKTITTMTSDGAVKFRSENNVTFEDSYRGQEFAPILDFDDAASIFPASVMAATKKFKKPTPIQSQSWPVVRSGRDLVAIAETGSGKTLAFTLPVLAKIVSEAADKPANKGLRTPLVLVLSPTRELAMQTAEVCEVAGASCGLRSLCVYGGTPKEGNIREIKKGIDILIATPGRLMDLMDNDKVLKLDKVAHLVLDEADRMLDMGFEPAIRRIVADVPKERQTLMFSATWPQSIQALANEFLIEPAKVVIGSQDLTANHKVTQIVEVMEGYQKDQRLQDLLNKYHKSRKNRILIFALYKKEAERIENTLRRKGWNVQGIHGDKSQAVRSQAIESFRNGSIPLLVATDVAARGLDIPDVEYVINVTFPLTIEDYVHRIGRTGRAGKSGTSHTFFTVDDKSHAGELQQVLREANQDVPEDLSKFGSHVKKKEHALYGSHFKKIDTDKKATRITFD